ncbi:MAG: thioredoxin fold domain-containing protein, partial [Gammaproteobacteria bacterium]|nr:thioredoxin fold domain-containing protein [Gammaproteobacteria bacterium]
FKQVILLLLVFLAEPVFAQQAGKVIPKASNLKVLADLARKHQLPIMLMVSQDHCPYCVLLKNDILNPMMISGDYVDRVIMAELVTDVGGSITDFDGKTISPRDVAVRYNSTFSPTLLFLDANGRQVRKRMVGVNTIEMYGYYVDESIDAARKTIRSR